MRKEPGQPGSAGQVTEQSKTNRIIKDGAPNPRKQPVGAAFGGDKPKSEGKKK